MRAADGEHAGDAGHESRGQHDIVALAARRGHHHDDFGHAGHMRGHGVHNHRAGISGFTAGHINAHAVERADLLAEQGAVFIGVVPRLHFLALVVAFHAGGGLLQGRLNVCGQALESGLQIGLGKREVGHALCRSAVKAVAVFDHGRIAALLHIGADIGHDLIDFRVLRGFKSQQGLERALEVGRLGVEQFHVFLCGCSIR